MDQFKILKSEIVSIITSNGRKSTPVEMLVRDYQNCMGCPLPFREFGCSRVIDLLMQMQDVLQIREERGGFVVQAYTNKSSHITNLIKEQRKRPMPRNYNIYHYNNVYKKVNPTPPRLRPVTNKSSHIEPVTSKSSQEPVTSKRSFVEPVTNKSSPVEPVISKNSHVEPVTSKSSHVKPVTSNRSYVEPVIDKISYVKPVTKSSYIEPVTSKSSHVELVTSKSSYVEPVISKSSYVEPVANKSLNTEPKNVTQLKAIKNIQIQPKEKVKNQEIQKTEIIKPKEILVEISPIIKCRSRSISVSTVPKPSYHESEISSVLECSSIVHDYEDNFHEILKAYPNGILIHDFLNEYKARFKECFNPKKYGFVSFESAVLSLRDIFLYKKTADNKWILFDRLDEFTPKINSRELSIPDLVLDNLAFLSQEYPDGIDGNDFIEKYSEQYRTELNFKLLGFNTVEDFLTKCSSIKVIIDGKCTVFPKRWDIKPKGPTFYEYNQYFDDICGPDDEIISLDFSNLKLAKVIICDVVSPDIFWIHVDDIKKDLIRMMYDLSEFYDELGDRYVLDWVSIKKNLVCAVKFDGKWHRGVINEIKDENFVEVTYVDYGTVFVVGIDEVRALHKIFLNYPKFAISSSLNGIVPSNPEIGYTPESCHFFASFIGQCFYTIVSSVNLTEPYLKLILIDTSQQEDVIINDLIVELGYASMDESAKEAQKALEIIPELNESMEEAQSTIIDPEENKEGEVIDICKIGNEHPKNTIIEFVIENKKLSLIKYRNSLCFLCDELIKLFTNEPYEEVQERLKNSANIFEITPINDPFLHWKLFKLYQRNEHHLIDSNSAYNYVKMIDPTSDTVEYNFFKLTVDLQLEFIRRIKNNSTSLNQNYK